MSKGKRVMGHLWDALRGISLGELLQIDFWISLAGGVGALVLALNAPEQILGAVSVAAGVVGVVIGAVIAGVAIQVAFLDQSFLRKLRAIHRDPIDYLAPFLFTVVIGVFAMLGLLVLATLSPSTPIAVIASVGTFVGFFSTWTVASLLPGMATLVQFVGLRQDALDAPDDVDIAPEKTRAQR